MRDLNEMNEMVWTGNEFETRAKAMYEAARGFVKDWYGVEVEAELTRTPIYTYGPRSPDQVLFTEVPQPWMFSITISRPAGCGPDDRKSWRRSWTEREIVESQSVEELTTVVSLWVNTIRDRVNTGI